MDKTKTYIKMSDHPKIQEYFPNKCGDIICGRGVNVGYNCRPAPDGDEGKSIFFKPFPMLCKLKKHEGHWYHTTAEYGDGWGMCKYFDNITWLPRQEDIQAMMGKTESAFCIYQAENKWGGEVYQDREQVFSIEMNSPEQLWLAFYMHEKHKLKWEDGKWQ